MTEKEQIAEQLEFVEWLKARGMYNPMESARAMQAMHAVWKAQRVEIQRLEALEALVFDGYVVHSHVAPEAKGRTRTQNVSDVLDAMKRAWDSGAKPLGLGPLVTPNG